MTNKTYTIPNSLRVVSWSVTIAVALASITSISTRCSAQSQPVHSTEQSVALKEAEDLNQKVIQLYNEGKYSAAIPLAERALAIFEKVLGKEHPDVATSLSNLAVLYEDQGNYQQAEPLYQRALAIREKVLGKEHPDVAQSLNNLASLYKDQGNYQQAEPLYQRALAIREKVLGKEHPDVAQSLNNLALLYKLQGNYQQAEPLYQRSLAIFEKVLGKEHPDVAQSLNNLALLYQDQGNYQQAEPLYQRALAIREKVLGKEHPSVATSLNNLAELYEVQGNYQQAEPLYQRALAIREKVLGKEHPDVAQSLNNLALLYKLQGNYQQAEPLYQRSLAIFEKVLGKEHPDVAQSLNNLASLYQDQGNYQQAEPLFQHALAIREKVLGKEHPDVAQSLNNLAGLYQVQGNYQQAEPLYQRALAIREKVLGKEHPDVATSLINLASLYKDQGNYQQAEPLLQRSLAILEKVLGKEHPSVAISLNNLASLYQDQGEISRAADFLRRGLEVEEHNLNLLNVVSEQRKQSYIRTFTGTTDATISLSLREANHNPDVSKLALNTVLRRKGRVLDAVANSMQILQSQLGQNKSAQKLFDERFKVLNQLSALISKPLGKQTADAYKTRFEQLETHRQRLEGEISVLSAEFRIQTQPVQLETVRAKIPQDAALVEIVQYKPYNPKAKPAQRWSKPHYAASVLRSNSEPKWVDLGDAETINKSIASFRTALTERSNLTSGSGKEKENVQLVQKLARTLDQQVMSPIRPFLGNARQLLISPDGELSLVPFEALKDERGEYLIQRYTFSYLTSGRDLLRFDSVERSRGNPVVLANVDYDSATVTAFKPNSSHLRGSSQRTGDWASTNLSHLDNEKEANAIKDVLPNAQILLGTNATKTAVQQLHGPAILHLATHGLFFPNQEISLNESLGNGFDQQSPGKVLKLENPLLRAGLALAGFNKRNKTPVGGDDGVLTAMEVAGLDLRGTQLVVLSACQTGLGDVKVGDGVYGLRRALVIAGSQSQVLSLWSVDNQATTALMSKYYQNLKAGIGRHEALQAAQREMLNTPNYQHPYFWASFIPSGDWKPLHK